MRNWIFLGLSIIISCIMVVKSGRFESVQALIDSMNLPAKEELLLYISQGFFYATLIIGLIYLIRRNKNKKKAEK